MAHPNYAKGARFERTVKADLETMGCFVVRAAGSHGPADLVVLVAGREPRLMACKVDGILRPAERESLLGTAERAGATAWLVHRRERGVIKYERVKL